MVTTLDSEQAVLDAVGSELGTSEWMTVTQARIDGFADATDDHQWIHVDPERAKDGPFGATVAHGYLTLSLVNRFLPEIVDVHMKMGVNYGTDKVRFPAAVPVGSRIRGRGELTDAREVSGGVQATIRVTVEIDGGERPACVVDTINRYYF